MYQQRSQILSQDRSSAKISSCHRKGQKYTLLLEGGLKRVPMEDLSNMEIITLHVLPKGAKVYPGRRSSKRVPVEDLGNNRLPSPSKIDEPALFQVRSPNEGKSWDKFLCPHSRCFRSYFDVIFLMYLESSVFWFFFQANLILINHPHRPSLANSECAERWSYNIQL